MRRFRPLQPPILQQDILHANYRYREYAPCKSLEKEIACYWTVDFLATDVQQWHRVIPDGCVDIIFDLRAPTLPKAAFVTGLMASYEIMKLSQPQSLFGIRFYSETVHRFLRNPVSSLMGYEPTLEDLWGDEALLLAEEILASPGVSSIKEKVETKLKQLARMNESKPDGLLQTGMQYMYAYRGNLSVRSLAEKLSYSERNVRRTFQNELGISPKELLGIIQFQSMLQEMYGANQLGFTELAMKYGYYDQPHFIKSFKHYYGMLPSELRKANEPRGVDVSGS